MSQIKGRPRSEGKEGLSLVQVHVWALRINFAVDLRTGTISQDITGRQCVVPLHVRKTCTRKKSCDADLTPKCPIIKTLGVLLPPEGYNLHATDIQSSVNIKIIVDQLSSSQTPFWTFKPPHWAYNLIVLFSCHTASMESIAIICQIIGFFHPI